MVIPLIEEAEHHLTEAFKRARSGRFQLEAAIRSVHAERALLHPARIPRDIEVEEIPTMRLEI